LYLCAPEIDLNKKTKKNRSSFSLFFLLDFDLHIPVIGPEFRLKPLLQLPQGQNSSGGRSFSTVALAYRFPVESLSSAVPMNLQGDLRAIFRSKT